MDSRLNPDRKLSVGDRGRHVFRKIVIYSYRDFLYGPDGYVYVSGGGQLYGMETSGGT